MYLEHKTLHQFSSELSFYLFRKKKKKKETFHKILGRSLWHILQLDFEKYMSELFVKYMNRSKLCIDRVKFKS